MKKQFYFKHANHPKGTLNKKFIKILRQGGHQKHFLSKSC